MGEINSKGLKFIYCFIIGILCGILIGSAAVTALVSYRMDKFYERIALLENTINDKNEKLEKLEKSINKSNFVLKDINLILIIDGNEIDNIDNIEIEKVIKEKYRPLVGKEVKNLDADILDQIIDKRILRFEDAEYKLSVKKLVLTDILKLWVSVELIE